MVPQPLIGSSRDIQHISSQLHSAARSDAPVFITGETGTGKELCARTIHQKGPRASKPFIALNCAALPRDLMEDELFGHARGAFTGAVDSRAGAVATANGGTLFLDEIGEMDLPLQAKLLRFLQDGSYRALGDSAQRQSSCRIICATNRAPETITSEGHMRPDLFYRLNVISLHLPPLRMRIQDIAPLARHFLAESAKRENREFTQIDPEALRLLEAYPWPGNIRQLQNAIRHAVIFHAGPVLLPAMLPQALSSRPAAPTAQTPASWYLSTSANDRARTIRPLAAVEREAIEAAISACDGNVQQAAALLNIAPSTIYRKKISW